MRPCRRALRCRSAESEAYSKDSAFSWRLTEVLADRGVLVRILGDLTLAPPLMITAAQVDDLLTIVDESLTLVEREQREC
jgi:adenosylmethionine-8-amino-7-oxononanoate aminotransferase